MGAGKKNYYDWTEKRNFELPSEHFEKINAHISAIEKQTQSEIVVRFVKDASDYQHLFWRQTTILMAITQLLMLSWLPLTYLPLTFLVGFVISKSLWGLKSWRNLVITNDEKSFALHLLTERLFLHHNVSATQQRSGVLIVVSLFEKRVEILADSGIYKLLPQSFWNDLLTQHQEEFRRGDYVAALTGILNDLAPELTASFPSLEHNPNELPNLPK